MIREFGALLSSASESRALDRYAMQSLKVPGLVLMENAGRGAFDGIVGTYGDALERVVIVCGPGQNGGDGYVVARHLHAMGTSPLCIRLGEAEAVHGDAKVNHDAAVALGIEILQWGATSKELITERLRGASLVVDALFGTGLTRAIEGAIESLVRAMNESGGIVVALDIPSGVCADSGQVLGSAVRAECTYSFGTLKKGSLQYPGAQYVGEAVVVSLGVPVPSEGTCRRLEAPWVGARVRARAPDDHKGKHGHVFVIGGAPGTSGAAILASLGAMRAGAGLVTLLSPAEALGEVSTELVEVMSQVLPEQPGEIAAFLDEQLVKADAVVCGPGLGFSPASRRVVELLAVSSRIPVVFDADALTILAGGQGLESLKLAEGPRVLTPHPGEAGRLLGEQTSTVQRDRYDAVRCLAERSGQTCILKGAGTIVQRGERSLVCSNGTPALGVAGTGDVLAGVVGAVVCSMPAFEAAAVAVYLHARAGELASIGDRGLLAREVAASIPHALVEARSQAMTS